MTCNGLSKHFDTGRTTLCYLNNHLDGGQGGRQVLGVGGSDSDWHTAGVQAAVESGNQVDSCTKMLILC